MRRELTKYFDDRVRELMQAADCSPSDRKPAARTGRGTNPSMTSGARDVREKNISLCFVIPSHKRNGSVTLIPLFKKGNVTAGVVAAAIQQAAVLMESGAAL